MPIQTLESDQVPINQAGIPAPLSRIVSASASQAAEDWPILSAIPRIVELDVARKSGALAYRSYDRQGATDWMKARGLDTEFTFEDRPYNELELSILARRKIAEIQRRNVMERAEGGIGQGAVRLGVALGVSILDPGNIASAFIPVFGEARYARMLAGAGGPVGRTGVRLLVGGIEGATGAAVVEPLLYAANKQQQADYTISDSLLNIGFGAIFGGALHVGAGVLADASYRSRVREFDRIVSEVTGAEPRPAETVRAAPRPVIDETEVRLISRQVDEALTAREEALRADAGLAPKVRIAEADTALRAVQDRLEPINRELMQSRQSQIAAEIERISADQNRVLFLRARHGVADAADIIEAQAVKTVDARRASLMQEAEALRGEAAQHGADIADFNRSRAAEVDLEQIRLARKGSLDDRIAALPKPLAEAMRRRLDQTVTNGVPAAEVISRLPSEQQAALGRAAVAQGVQDQPVRLEGLARNDLEQIRKDASDAVNPDNAPLANPEAVKVADQELTAGGDELAVAQKQLAEAETELRDSQATLTEELPAEVKAEIDAAQAFAEQADSYGEMGRLLAQCALRHAV